ncbi:YdeI/OmpD-associated family protein [Sediminicola luteus]|uniref:Bacteriocin-protection protein n=1 Tax=Sediminicola luteus TaxID=319238 RepID=A0A2A4G4J7_9FLAO|nr:YdeI/OmpD-associated family protein [Sediminicola luteus]PCE62900.1 hypothetical protein B7P33_16625 [Sediminicola luteus]
MSQSDTPTFYPKNRKAWRQWLAANHQTKSAIWVIYYKTGAQKPSLTWSEAVDEALCFGWIDSTKKTIDVERYMQYFTPRKPKSNWSKINKDKVAQLTTQGLMAPAGLESVRIAQENGAWIYLDSVENLEIPPDLAQALHQNPKAETHFQAFGKSKKKAVLYWILSAKRATTRNKRIAEVVQQATQNQLPF